MIAYNYTDSTEQYHEDIFTVLALNRVSPKTRLSLYAASSVVINCVYVTNAAANGRVVLTV